MASVIHQGLPEGTRFNTTDKSEGKVGRTNEDAETRDLAEGGDRTSAFSLDVFYFWGH